MSGNTPRERSEQSNTGVSRRATTTPASWAPRASRETMGVPIRFPIRSGIRYFA